MKLKLETKRNNCVFLGQPSITKHYLFVLKTMCELDILVRIKKLLVQFRSRMREVVVNFTLLLLAGAGNPVSSSRGSNGI